MTVNADKIKTILVSRTDRLGDLVLSTPVFQAIKENYPDRMLVVLVNEGSSEILESNPYIDELIKFSPKGRHKGFLGFFRLRRDIRKHRPECAVILFTRLKIAASVFFAGVRYRIGPVSKLHARFLFNRGIRQARSTVEMHEAEYNLNLLLPLGIKPWGRNYSPLVKVPDQYKIEIKDWLSNIRREHRKIIIVHPGMGDSALNWPEVNYTELAQRLSENHTVICTGSYGEKDLVGRIISKAPGVNSFLGENLGKFTALLDYADLVIVPSTGPMHVANALGKKLITFFPPIRVQSVARWGPFRMNEKRVRILVPDTNCMQEFNCQKEDCHYFPCMKMLTVDDAMESVRELLETGE